MKLMWDRTCYRTLCSCVTALICGFLAALPLAAQGNPRVVPIHLVPADYEFDVERFKLNVQAIDDVRAWYERALGGQTFRAEPLVVHWSRYPFDSLAAEEFQNWWPLLEKEFTDYGMDWNDGADFKLLFLAQGAGAWAGADSENGGIEHVEDAARTDDGDFGGLAVIGDSSIAGVLAGVCPWDGIEGGTAWWCNWDTYRGTIAHELGHTFGIPHPSAFSEPGSDGSPPSWDCPTEGETVMQCHWGFPYDSLLTFEREHMRSLRFFPLASDAVSDLLVDRLPVSADAGVRIFRGRRAEMPRIRREGGAFTGYPFGVIVPAGRSVTWLLGGACRTLVMDVGREERAGGRGTITVESGEDSREIDVDPVGPMRIEQRVCGDSVRISVDGQRRFAGVIGNPRLVGR